MHTPIAQKMTMVQEERIAQEIKLVPQEDFLKRITRQARRIQINSLTSQVVTEINCYSDKRVIKVRANIPFKYLIKI